MATITISVDDRSIMASLRKILKTMNGVTILPESRKQVKKSGIDEAMDDIKYGRVTEYADVDDMFEKLDI